MTEAEIRDEIASVFNEHTVPGHFWSVAPG